MTGERRVRQGLILCLLLGAGVGIVAVVRRLDGRATWEGTQPC